MHENSKIKKLIIIIVVVLIATFFAGYCLGKNTNSSKKSKKTSTSFQSSGKKSELDKIKKEIKECYFDQVKDVIVDANEFRDIYYVVYSYVNNSSKQLCFRSNGSMFEYSSKKFSTNNANIKSFESRLNQKVIMGFANFGDGMNDNEKEGEYWFLLEDYSIVRFDSEADTISQESSFVNNGWGRDEETKPTIENMKTITEKERIISWSDSLSQVTVINNNKMCIYKKEYRYDPERWEGKYVLELSEERTLPENGTIDIIYSNDFIKIGDDYYVYMQTNRDETNEYVDATAQFDFVKLATDKFKDDIAYWDGHILVMKSGKVYNSSFEHYYY